MDNYVEKLLIKVLVAGDLNIINFSDLMGIGGQG